MRLKLNRLHLLSLSRSPKSLYHSEKIFLRVTATGLVYFLKSILKKKVRCYCSLPPPFFWHRYGNLQTFPNPTK